MEERPSEQHSHPKYPGQLHPDAAEPFLDGFDLKDARFVALVIHASHAASQSGIYHDRAIDLLTHISQNRPASPDYVKSYLDTVIDTGGQLWLEVKSEPNIPQYIAKIHPSLIPPSRLSLLN